MSIRVENCTIPGILVNCSTFEGNLYAGYCSWEASFSDSSILGFLFLEILNSSLGFASAGYLHIIVNGNEGFDFL